MQNREMRRPKMIVQILLHVPGLAGYPHRLHWIRLLLPAEGQRCFGLQLHSFLHVRGLFLAPFGLMRCSRVLFPGKKDARRNFELPASMTGGFVIYLLLVRFNSSGEVRLTFKLPVITLSTGSVDVSIFIPQIGASLVAHNINLPSCFQHAEYH